MSGSSSVMDAFIFGWVAEEKGESGERAEGEGERRPLLVSLEDTGCVPASCAFASSPIKLDSYAAHQSQNAQSVGHEMQTPIGGTTAAQSQAHQVQNGLKGLRKDASTLTDLCSSSHLDEVEIVTLVEEQIPRYTLRADTLTQFTGYDNEDWFIPYPVLPQQSEIELDLSPELTKETLDYFVQSGNRVSQMTRTYNDIDAVTRLLEEKERDLELAARIGQKLLQKNQSLEQKNDQLEEEISNSREQLTQLKHEVHRKTELLHIYQNHEYDGSDSDSNDGSLPDNLQRKIRLLEEENFQLELKSNQVNKETLNLEEKEIQLVNDLMQQHSDLNLQNQSLSEELSNKIEECNKQQEEITHLLAQIVDLQSKNKQYKVENEDLYAHLQAAKECQTDLTTELADFKDKYEEVLDLFHETQERLRAKHRKGLPHVSRRGTHSPYINPDSLASELESSISSDSGSFNPNTRQLHNLKVFETVRYAKQQKASASLNPTQLPHLYNSSSVQSSSFASGSICSIPTLSPGPQCSPAHARHGPLSSSSPMFVGGSRNTLNSLDSASDSESSVYADGGGDDSSYSSLSSLGRPGVPGSNDLETALRRLSLRRQTESEYMISRHPRFDDAHTPNQCRTPDSIMSTGSGMSAFSGMTGASGYAIRHYHIPEKLQIVKPMEGSVTLHQWQQLATPHMGGIFEERPGVQIKGERRLDEIDDIYSLNDLEEDDEVSHPGKFFDSTSTIYTFTTSTVLHPDENTRVTPSVSSQMTTVSTGPSSCMSSCLNSPQGRERATSTFSTTLSLAKLLHERNISVGDLTGSSSVLTNADGESSSSKEPPPATPCNSPDGTPPPSPPPFAPLRIPSLAGLGTALSRGAELFGVPSSHSSSRSSRRRTTRSSHNAGQSPKDKEFTSAATTSGLTNIKLMEKLNELGLDSVKVSTSSLLPATSYTLPTYHHMKPLSPMAQLTSLRMLSMTGLMVRAPSPNSEMGVTLTTTTSDGITTRGPQVQPPTSLPLPHSFNLAGPALELGTIGTLASFRKGGLS